MNNTELAELKASMTSAQTAFRSASDAYLKLKFSDEAKAAKVSAEKAYSDAHLASLSEAEIEGRAINAASDAASLQTMSKAFASLAEKDQRPAIQERCVCGGCTNVRRVNGLTICDDCAE